MKYRCLIGIFLCISLLTGCGIVSQVFHQLEEPEDLPKVRTYDTDEDAPTKLEDIILYDINNNQTEELMARFSPSMVDAVGEDDARAFIRELNEILHGTIQHYTIEKTGFSSYRGRGGKRSTGYLMTLFTDREIFLLFYQDCTEDTSGPDHKNNRQSIGVTDMQLYPASLWHNRENRGQEDEVPLKIYRPENYARDITDPGKSYTGYSIEYLQVNSMTYSLDEALCHALMELLSTQCGFVGDITYAESDTIESSLYGTDFTQMVEDARGTRFYIKTEYRKSGGAQITGIADADQKMIYENPLE